MRLKYYLEMAAARLSDLQGTYYHGTSHEEAAQKIMKEGIKPPDLTQRKENALTPRKGKVYITKNVGYAQIYAVGGDFAGNKMTEENWSLSGQHGYIFVIDGSQIQDIEPDEDDVAEIMYSLGTDNFTYLSKHLNQKKIEENRWILGYARRVLSEVDAEYLYPSPDKEDYTSETDDEGEADENYESDFRDWEELVRSGSAWDAFLNSDAQLHLMVPAAKYMLDRTKMSADQRLKLIDCGTHIAHKGALKPKEVWKIDKAKTHLLKRDGSTFFKIAERIK